jgi:hypothetical protein
MHLEELKVGLMLLPLAPVLPIDDSHSPDDEVLFISSWRGLLNNTWMKAGMLAPLNFTTSLACCLDCIAQLHVNRYQQIRSRKEMDVNL